MIDLSFTEKASRMQNTPQGKLEWRRSEDSLPICLLQTRERVTKNLGSCTDLTFTSTVTRQLVEVDEQTPVDRAVGVYRREWFRFSKTKSPPILSTHELWVCIFWTNPEGVSFLRARRVQSPAESVGPLWERTARAGRLTLGRQCDPVILLTQQRRNSKNSYKKAFLSKFQWIRSQVVLKEDLQ